MTVLLYSGLAVLLGAAAIGLVILMDDKKTKT